MKEYNILVVMKIELDEIRCITETAITIKGSRRRITVPSEVVEILELKNSDKLRWIVHHDGKIQLQKVNK
jgi:bifunctional DNA-binding transcriptional regulator/antitoxin component of YhaV-PrlF toxin-antitoxin module